MSRKDWNVVLSTADRDFELKAPGGGLDAGVVRGVERARRAFEDFFSPYEEVSVEPEAFFEGNGQLVVFFLQRARPLGSTAVVERRAAHLWTMREGKRPGSRSSPSATRPSKQLGCRSKTSRRLMNLRDTARAMSQENVEIARRDYEAFARGDLDAVFDEFMHSEIEAHDPPEVPDATIYRGREAVRRDWEQTADLFEDFSIDLEKASIGATRSSSFCVFGGEGGKAAPNSRHRWRMSGLSAMERRLRFVSSSTVLSPRSRGPVAARRSLRLLSLRDTARGDVAGEFSTR